MFTQRVKVKPVTKSNQSDGGGPRTHHTLIVWNDRTILTHSIDCTSTCPALWDPRPPGISSTSKVPQHSTKNESTELEKLCCTHDSEFSDDKRSADRVLDWAVSWSLRSWRRNEWCYECTYAFFPPLPRCIVAMPAERVERDGSGVELLSLCVGCSLQSAASVVAGSTDLLRSGMRHRSRLGSCS